MKKLSIFAVLALVILGSCTMEKRHYRSGFYLSLSKPYSQEKNVPNKNTELHGQCAMPDEGNLTENSTSRICTLSTDAPDTNTSVAINSDNQALTTQQNGLPTLSFPVVESEMETSKDFDNANISQVGDTNFPGWAYIIIALLIPPLAVALKYGIHKAFWFCLIFTLLGFVPGVVYALIYYALQGDNPKN